MFGWKSADAAWIDACAEADRLDSGWRWEDLLAQRPELPPEQDARQVALVAAAALPEKWPDWEQRLENRGLAPSIESLDFDHPAEYASAISDRATVVQRLEHDLEPKARNTRLTDTAQLILGDLLNESDQSLKLAHSILKLDIGRVAVNPQPAFLDLPDLSPMRRVVQLLQFEARLAATRNMVDIALLDAETMLALANAACQPPMLITILVAFAIHNNLAATAERALAQGEASAVALRRLQTRIAESASDRMLLLGMRGERAINEQLIRAIDNGQISNEQIRRLEAGPSLFLSGWRKVYMSICNWLVPETCKRHRAGVIRYYTTLVESLKREIDSPMRETELLASTRKTIARSIQYSQSGAESMISADYQQRSKLRALRCALAAEQYRLRHSRWPNELLDLTPLYLSAVPLDPFDLEPLRYRRLADGVVFYSVGHDGQDSGGDVHSGGARPPDIGIRLWNPECRGIDVEKN